MKKRSAVLAFLLFMTGMVMTWSQEVIEEIVAIVNEDIITLSEYKAYHDSLHQELNRELRARPQGQEFDAKKFNSMYAELKKNLLDMMIHEKLLLQEAEREGYKVDEQVKMYLEGIKKDNNIDSDEELIRGLKQQGIDFEEFKEQIEKRYLREMVVYMAVGTSIVIDDSEIVNYYKLHPEEFTESPEYRLRAIYLSTEGRNEEELKTRKREIIEKITAGEDFAALASQYSEGPEKDNQGDLGSFKKGELEKTLEQAVDKVKVNDITPWLNVRNGWFLLKLEERKESRMKSFEEVKKEIGQKLFAEETQKKQGKYIKDLRARSYIKILNPNPLEF